MSWVTVRIRRHERGVWLRHGDFKAILKPGTYRFWSRLWSRRDRVEAFSTLETKFEHPLLDVIVAHKPARDHLHVVDLADPQRALVWRDGRLTYILGPGRHAFWREPGELKVEIHDVAEFCLRHPQLAAVLQHPAAARYLEGVKVEAHEEVLLYLDGRFVEKLPVGLHVFWKGTGQIVAKTIDGREQVADVAGQEIMTRDKVTLRVNLVVTFQVVDAVKAVTVVSDYAQALYREAQLALRGAVGARDLDTLLADKEAVGRDVREVLVGRAAEFGVAVRSVGLRDIILPGDMRAILNQVVEAAKRAEANLIRRREETAAARSQANTAKLLEASPQLARLKELEILQEILAGTKATFILGSGDLAEQVRGLVRGEAAGQAPA